ncbi:MAG: hypothetical protein F6J98_12060 [Moorea sp. SIO4G2]|nr:hypothetical protein [Moorena sp. SIO4G2]
MQSLMGETPAGRRCIAIFSSGQDAHSTPIHSSIQQRRKSLPTPYSLLPTPYSLLPTPYSLLPTPYSLLPTPYSLLPLTQIAYFLVNRQTPSQFCGTP